MFLLLVALSYMKLRVKDYRNLYKFESITHCLHMAPPLPLEVKSCHFRQITNQIQSQKIDIALLRFLFFDIKKQIKDLLKNV